MSHAAIEDAYWRRATSAHVTVKPKSHAAIVSTDKRSPRELTLRLSHIDEGLGFALVDELLRNATVEFAGYRRPHPAVDDHVIRIVTRSGTPWGIVWGSALDAMEAFLVSVEAQLKQKKDEATWFGELHFDHVSVTAVNAFRRALLGEVRTLAISHCAIKKNTGLINDEVLLERMALLPIRTPISMGESAFTPGVVSSDTTEDFSMKVRCPALHEGKGRMRSQFTVTSAHLLPHPHMETAHHIVTIDPRLRKPNESMTFPLTILRPGDELVLAATVRAGEGTTHARFSPAYLTDYHISDRDLVDDSIARVRIAFGMVGQLTFAEAMHATVRVLRGHLAALRQHEGVA